MTLTFIGDVHGWHDRLVELLADLTGPLLFLGDLIDRGPESAAVVATVKELVDAGRARCLLGNHEFALVRGLGVPERSIAPYPPLIKAWWERYGGQTTVRSYGLDRFDPDALRRALGDHLLWLADLPWYLEGEEEGQRWLAIHGGVGEEPWATQARDLGVGRWWRRARTVLPPQLYGKSLHFTRPPDLSPDICIVSGHTPLVRPLVNATRILCDTTGGKAGTALTAVEIPGGRIHQSRIGVIAGALPG
jgi:hypothetical protein